ncbi:thiamine phosphate synthase [Weissella sagaensis]|jgi:thiamine-phosphate pyrophosphorylase|uniref:Thiamine-phosphate synthase n=1 Tax=Weissella sagaensis TaxID=2559928 RepID=A0ABW1RRR3_9LACO|nr:thiamine phosphate synthase [Weissella sagaensis]KAA8432280.1 thiamine phosphate synthase [Weissella paramesenteroides]MBU7568499.1 thiamine phosphate synthase [Weissella hellenica]KAA8439452.1 thiamine phosphate synthase [Weissella paramesenteroides]QDJ58504.1 thiamine phosphate synthase [Weissella hellenica]QEA57444.1 thiamine phosphate synthase [Weissella hellenica]
MAKELYLVTSRYDENEETFLERVNTACANGVTFVQLREKDLTTRAYYELAIKVKKITDRYHLPLIIDDRIDICLAIDASGAHIGDDELPVDVARKLLGPNKILGVSAKTVARAVEAEQQGADYLGTGAMFPTQTKVITKPTSKQTLKEITKTVDIPVFAIGGIKEHNINTLTDTNIVGVAVVSEIMQAPNIADKVKQLKEAISLL